MAEPGTLKKGDRVRLRANPGKMGTLTGRSRIAGGFNLLEVMYGPNDLQNVREGQLEKVPEHETIHDLFDSGRFGGPRDLASILITAKLSGELTNVFYSMGIGTTDFLPHQFKPVLKFLESPRGRLLVADEVGLGKTIESIYIWKELQARDGARRLLVVCPSMLREKWKRDLELRFGEESELVDAATLLEKLQGSSRGASGRSFILIASLEGIRARMSDWDPSAFASRAKLCGYLEELAEKSMDPLLDLVIVDEAHYLRNSSTASHQTASLLRDNAANFLLLSATPIQTSEENLFNLLKLLSPEEFVNLETFSQIARKNSTLIELETILRYRAGSLSGDELVRAVEAARETVGEDLAGSILLAARKGMLTPGERIDLARNVSERSYFSTYINRTRKRDVLENRVIREPHTVNFKFSDYEKSLYMTVTAHLRGKSVRKSTLSEFVLIARQRQMTSCLPAAFAHWKDQKSMDDQLWDDLGIDSPVESAGKPELHQDGDELPVEVNLSILEWNDSKFAQLYQALQALLRSNPAEKVIIFSFYRGTIHYLERRLQARGFRTASIAGGMGAEKYRIIDSFARKDGPQILISSEVGAEGIDLQFCRIIINYDLPWNPMKLEQRIGRVDRIGQTSDRILIYNLSCEDTIEDRVLMKLYERINIFKCSIGDLEDIMGDVVERLALELMNPSLSDEERARRAEQNILALEQKRKLRNELEDKAIDLFGFGDYIIRSITDARELDRFVGPEDTMGIVENFFSIQYPGTRVELARPGASLLLKLSPDAKASFSAYIQKTRPPVGSDLGRCDMDTLCVFDPRAEADRRIGNVEQIDGIHPLIRWIVEEHKNLERNRQPCSSMRVGSQAAGLPPGVYVYYVHQWEAQGWKTRKELQFFAAASSGSPLPQRDAERLVTASFRRGRTWMDWAENITIQRARSVLDSLMDAAYRLHGEFEAGFVADNERMCNRQEEYASRTAERKIAEMEDLVQRLQSEGKLKVIPMHRGRIAKIAEHLEVQRARIRRYRIVDVAPARELAAGIINVEV